MAKCHQELLNEEWDVESEGTIEESSFAVKTWRYRGVRLFATLVTGQHPLWHLYVMAACGRKEASKLRAEIRLSSNLVPECNDVFYRPILHIGSPVKWDHNDSKMKEFTSILHLPAAVVCKHSEGPIEGELQIPLTIKIFEKVFPTAEKTDFNENNELDQNMEDAK